MTTLHLPSTVPLQSVCEALRLLGLEPDARYTRGAVVFRPIVGKPLRPVRRPDLSTPQARIRAVALRMEVAI